MPLRARLPCGFRVPRFRRARAPSARPEPLGGVSERLEPRSPPSAHPAHGAPARCGHGSANAPPLTQQRTLGRASQNCPKSWMPAPSESITGAADQDAPCFGFSRGVLGSDGPVSISKPSTIANKPPA